MEPKKTAGAPRKGGVTTANSFKKPEEVVASIEVIAEYKMKLRPDKTFVLGITAGIFVGLGVVVGSSMSFGSPSLEPGMSKFAYASLFPVVLMLVLILGGELVTSNMSIMTLGVLAQRVPIWKALRNLVVSYLGNLVGSLLVASILMKSTGLFDTGAVHNGFIAAAEKKVHLTWAQAVTRAIGCNFLVVAAVWMCQAAEDISGKILAIWFPICVFAAAGFEHSVANMTFIPAGMMLGADITVGQFLGRNLIPVTIGNIIGAMSLTIPYYYVYWLPNHPIDFKACDFGFRHCFRRPEGEDELRKPASTNPAAANPPGAMVIGTAASLPAGIELQDIIVGTPYISSTPVIRPAADGAGTPNALVTVREDGGPPGVTSRANPTGPLSSESQKKPTSAALPANMPLHRLAIRAAALRAEDAAQAGSPAAFSMAPGANATAAAPKNIDTKDSKGAKDAKSQQ